jgi:hypothetical protein
LDKAQGASLLVATQIGIKLSGTLDVNPPFTSILMPSKDNTFEKISISGFSYAVSGDHDIQHNVIENSKFEECGYGIVFGENTNLGGVGQATGPINNTITNQIQNSQTSTCNGVWIKAGKATSATITHFSVK